MFTEHRSLLSFLLLLITFFPCFSFTYSLYFYHFLIFFLPACFFFLSFLPEFLNYTPQYISFFGLVLCPWCSQSPYPTSSPTTNPHLRNTFQFPCSVFQACHLICDLCSPLHSADCCCSIMPWLDVMCCLSGSSGAAALVSPVAWIHTTAGGQEWRAFWTTGYPAPFIIPSPGVRLLL